jgi:PAS domain S-box-containing protein
MHRLSSLRVRLMLLVLVAIVPALGLSVHSAFRHRRTAVQVAKQEVQRKALSAALETEVILNGIGQLLLTLGRDSDAITSGSFRKAAQYKEILKRSYWLANLGLAAPSGDLIFSTVETTAPANFADRPFFQRVLQTGDLTIGEYHVGRVSGKRSLGFYYPILNGGRQPQAILFAALNLDWAAYQLRSLGKRDLPASSTIMIFDRNGTVLARYPEHEKHVGTTEPELFTTIARRRVGVMENDGMDGITRFYGYAPANSMFRGGDVYVAVGVPREVALFEAQSALERSLLWCAIAGLISLIAAWLGANLSILRGVRALLRATDRLAEGDLSARSGARGKHGEIAQLAGAFDQMAGALEQREAERCRAEEQLRRSEIYFRSLIENASDIIVVINGDRRIRYISPAVERSLGYKPEEIVAKRADELLDPSETPSLAQAFSETISQPDSWRMQTFRMRHRDGRWRVFEGVGHNLLHDPAVAGLVINIRDISERRQLEERLQQSLKMEAIGRLAGGVAHDFNNLLTAILGYTGLLLDRLSDRDPARREVLEIQKAGERAADLTRQLLAFSRRQVLQPRVIRVNQIIAEMDRMLRRLIGEDVDLATILEADLGYARVDPTQIEQVIMNLAINARDAMPNGGKLTIESRNLELDESYARKHADIQPGPYIMIAVSDTGCGMDADTLARVFEPFFTTKAVGKGTGLGLSTIYGIVKQSGGHVWVYSEPGKGTTFKIYFPRIEPPGEAEESTRAPAGTLQGAETILVTEDEVEVRKLVCEVLALYGYRVLDAANVEEALRAAREHAGPIHLLLTDVVMPGLSGRELAERVAAVRPDIRVLYMSGYTDNAIIHHGVLDNGTAFLQKPFPPALLARKVRAVLDEIPSPQNPEMVGWSL